MGRGQSISGYYGQPFTMFGRRCLPRGTVDRAVCEGLNRLGNAANVVSSSQRALTELCATYIIICVYSAYEHGIVFL